MYLLVLSYLYCYSTKEYKNMIEVEYYGNSEYIFYDNRCFINFRFLIFSISAYCAIRNIFNDKEIGKLPLCYLYNIIK